MGWAEPLKKVLRQLPAPVFWLGVWQLSAFLVDWRLGGRGNELLLPYPLSVLSALGELAAPVILVSHEPAVLDRADRVIRLDGPPLTLLSAP